MTLAILTPVLLSCSPNKSCTIISNGEKWVYEHELAHCAGWKHEPFAAADPPKRYRHAFTGQVTLIRCGRKYQCKSVRKRCFAEWQARGEDVSAYAGTAGYRDFVGCSFND
jgi:hypothetical protein